MATDIEALVRNAVRELTANAEPTRTREKKRIDAITLDDAKFLAAEVEKKAREMGVNAVVAIADEGGNLKLCECMDNSYLASRDIAINKAYTVVALKMPTAARIIPSPINPPWIRLHHRRIFALSASAFRISRYRR